MIYKPRRVNFAEQEQAWTTKAAESKMAIWLISETVIEVVFIWQQHLFCLFLVQRFRLISFSIASWLLSLCEQKAVRETHVGCRAAVYKARLCAAELAHLKCTWGPREPCRRDRSEAPLCWSQGSTHFSSGCSTPPYLMGGTQEEMCWVCWKGCSILFFLSLLPSFPSFVSPGSRCLRLDICHLLACSCWFITVKDIVILKSIPR